MEPSDTATTRPPEELSGSARPVGPATTGRSRVGFACLWDATIESTWSSTPWALRDELARRVPLDDLGAHASPPLRSALRMLSVRRTTTGWASLWRSSFLTDRVIERTLRREVARQKPAVALEVLDLATLPCPYFVLRDTTWGQLRQLHDEGLSFEMLGHPGFTASRIDRRWARERAILENAEGVIATSTWMRDGLLADGMKPERVHVVPLGANASPPFNEALVEAMTERIGRERRRLLFVGRDFRRKAGDLVVEALAILRQRRPDITLTVVGPREWPLPGAIPDGVDFKGPLGMQQVAALYGSHDLFVMPSRFEAFGLVFIEALSVGLPCVGRNRCAMPELIREGTTGTLLANGDAGELADRIQRTLDDEDLYRRCAENVPAVRARYSWSSAAEDIERLLRPFLQG
jgi:glycosyltransferase involved in cell wall biosynthesis